MKFNANYSHFKWILNTMLNICKIYAQLRFFFSYILRKRYYFNYVLSVKVKSIDSVVRALVGNLQCPIRNGFSITGVSVIPIWKPSLLGFPDFRELNYGRKIHCVRSSEARAWQIPRNIPQKDAVIPMIPLYLPRPDHVHMSH